MLNQRSTVERAFEIAREGSCRTVEELRRSLAREAMPNIDAHLAGSGIRKQLKALMNQARVGTSGSGRA